MRRVKVLVVDDSIMFRKMLSEFLDEDPEIEVVAMAGDPYQARDMIIRFNPDVMTLDIEMPRMNGIEFMKKLMPRHPMKVIMISSMQQTPTDYAIYGAVDYLQKPHDMDGGAIYKWVHEELIAKVKAAYHDKLAEEKKKQIAVSPNNFKRKYNNKIVAIGASTGGTEAILSVVKNFYPNIPGTVIVQHMPPGFTEMYAARLDKECRVKVREAKDGDLVEDGKILIAPGDKHMTLMRENGRYYVKCFEAEKVSGHCPSVDVLFKSVAKAAASDAVGVILTGMGSDGARGLLAMRKRGAHTIGEDEKSCVVYGMPKVAYDIGAVQYQEPLENIASKIYNILNTIP